VLEAYPHSYDVSLGVPALRCIPYMPFVRTYVLCASFCPCCVFLPQVLFDANGCLRRYADSREILGEFYELRLERYRSRKEYLEGKLQSEADKITSQARFVMEMYNGTIVFRECIRETVQCMES